MPLSISDFPSDGIIYTADAVMFHVDAVARWLPTCNHPAIGSMVPLGHLRINSTGDLMNVNQIIKSVNEWWLGEYNSNYLDAQSLAHSLVGSAIAYKPAEDQQLYLFSGNGGYYVVKCEDAMDYLFMIQQHSLLFDRKPLARMPDHESTYSFNAELNSRLAQQGIKLVSRGRNIWLAIGPADNMQAKLMTAFKPTPAAKPAAPKPFEPGPSHE